MASIFPLLFDQRFNSIYHPFQTFFSDNSDFFGVSTNVEIDWKETRDCHVFHVDLPGLSKSDVRLQLHQGNGNGNVLQITGERSDDVDDAAATWHCKERTTGKFIRQFRLPENANTNDEIKAELENGVLTVTVAKDDRVKKIPEKHKAVEIKISGDEHKRTPNPKGLGRFVCCKA